MRKSVGVSSPGQIVQDMPIPHPPNPVFPSADEVLFISSKLPGAPYRLRFFPFRPHHPLEQNYIDEAIKRVNPGELLIDDLGYFKQEAIGVGGILSIMGRKLYAWMIH